jgi:chromosome segregation ATPase
MHWRLKHTAVCRVVILDKQVSDRDRQLEDLRTRLAQEHEANDSDTRSADLALQLKASEQRGTNMQSRIAHLNAQLHTLETVNESLRTASAAQADAKLQEVAKVREARLEAQAHETRARGLRTSLRLAEHQLREKTTEADALHVHLEQLDEQCGAANTAAVQAQLAASAGGAALADAQRRVQALQRQLDAQRASTAAALEDATTSGSAADASRRQAAALSADVYRAEARAAAAAARAEALQAALAAADEHAAELKGALLERATEAGALSAEASTQVRSLEASVRGLQGRNRALEAQVAEGESSLAKAHDATAKAQEKYQEAAQRAAQHEATAERLSSQLLEARKAAEAHLAVANEREAGLEVLRCEIAERLQQQDALLGQGRRLESGERTAKAVVTALSSQIRSLEATLAEKDADATLMQQAAADAAQTVRDTRAEAAAAQERCEILRKQIAVLHLRLQKQGSAIEGTVEQAEEAKAVAELRAQKADAAAAESARLQRALRALESQNATLERARARHDDAAAAAAAAVADARRAVLSEQERARDVSMGAHSAEQRAAALEQELASVKHAYEKQVAAAEEAAAAAHALRAAAMQQQDEMRSASAALVVAEGRAERTGSENATLQHKVAKLQAELDERAQALGYAAAAMQERDVEEGAGRAEALRAADTAQRRDARIAALSREVETKTRALEVRF